jgi:hypothetical protein
LNISRILPVLIAALALTLPSHASTIDVQFTTLPTDMENGTYNGFVGGTVNGIAFSNLICDDYDHTTYVPSGDLQYNVYTLADFGQARFAGEPNSLQNYENAALLVYSLQNLAVVNSYIPANQQLTVGDLQYALWDTFTPGSGTTANSSGALAILNAASTSFRVPIDLDASLRIYVPAAPFTSNQEFLQVQETVQPQINNSSVAEPATVALSITGLLSIGALLAKRRARSSATATRLGQPTPDPA